MVRAVLDRDAMVRDPHVCSLARDRATLFALGGLAKQPMTVVPATIDDLASQATAPSHVLDSESMLSQPSVLSNHGRPGSFSFEVHQAARPRADAASHAGGRI